MQQKSKSQLIEEVYSLRRRIAELEREQTDNLGIAKSIISTEMQLEKSLWESGTHLRMLIDMLPHGILEFDATGVITLSNPAHAKMHGYEAEELVGQRVCELSIDESRQAKLRKHLAYLVNEQPTPEPYYNINRTKDGGTIDVQVDWAYKRNESGNVTGFVSVVTDITESKKTKDKLKRAHEELEQRVLERTQDLTDINRTLSNEITVRRLAQEELKLSHEILQNISGGVCLVCLEDSTFVFTSPRFEEMFGYEANELIGQHCSVLVGPNNEPPQETVDRIIGEIKESQFWSGDVHAIQKDKAELWTHTTVSTFEHALHGRVMVAVVEDITERKQIERQMQLNQFAIDSCSDPVFWIRFDGRIAYANEAASLVLGYSIDELMTMSVPEIDPDFPRENWANQWRELQKAGSATFESHHRTKSGRVFPVEISTTCLNVDEVEFMWVFVRDIAERTLSEENTRRWAAALQAVGEVTMITNTKGTIQYINSAFEKLYGIAPDHALGKTPRILKSGRHDASFYRQLWETITSGKVWSNEITNRCADGTLIEVHETISPVYDLSKKVTGYVSVARDITDRKNAEARTRQLEAHLAHASRLNTIGATVAGLAHEINQPLSAVSTYADVCRRLLKAGENRELAETLEKVAHQAERAGQIIHRVQSFVRKDEPHTSTVDINTLIRDTVDFFDAESKLRRINISLVLDDSLPLVMIDAVQIQQVIVNLMQNAFDAMKGMDNGNCTLAIESSRDDDDRLTIVIRDSGVGFEDNAIDRIFDSFFTTKPDGTGLGLSISRSIIQAHGGTLSVTQNPDGGAAFYLSIPIIQEVANANE